MLLSESTVASVSVFFANSEPLLRYCHIPKNMAAANATPRRLVKIDVVEDVLLFIVISCSVNCTKR
jgi:hypothetical protein